MKLIAETILSNMLTANASSVETNLSDFTPYNGGTISRDTTTAYVGSASLKFVNPGSNASGEGMYVAVNTTAGQVYTFSAYLKGSGTVHVRATGGGTGASLGTAPDVIISSGAWVRTSVTFTAQTGTTSTNLIIDTTSAQAVTFWADALQLESGAILTPWQSGGVQNVTFSSIPQTYRHLRLMIAGRFDGAYNGVDLCIRFNSDTTSNYDNQSLRGFGTTVQASEGIGANIAAICSFPAANSTPSSTAGIAVATVYGYSLTTWQKSATSLYGYEKAQSSGNLNVFSGAVFWRSTSAVTSITLLPSVSVNFLANTVIGLYGLD